MKGQVFAHTFELQRLVKAKKLKELVCAARIAEVRMHRPALRTRLTAPAPVARADARACETCPTTVTLHTGADISMQEADEPASQTEVDNGAGTSHVATRKHAHSQLGGGGCAP